MLLSKINLIEAQKSPVFKLGMNAQRLFRRVLGNYRKRISQHFTSRNHPGRPRDLARGGSLILILIIFNCSCQMRQIANIDSKGKNIICFGDSLTYGYGLDAQESYPAILSQMLKQDVINAGRNGDTTAMAKERLEKEVLEKDPLLVIIILGANDFMQGIPEKQTFSNLKNIINRIKSRGAMVALGELGPFFMYTYKDEYKKLAKEENILLIEGVLSGIFGQADLMSDNVHPNPKGYNKLAQKVYKAILPILEENKKRGNYE